MSKTLYDYLEVNPTASAEIIKSAYEALLEHYDPDRNRGFREDAANRIKIISHAYAVLSDPVQRRQYDEKIARISNRNVPDLAGGPTGAKTNANSGWRENLREQSSESRARPKHGTTVDATVKYAGFWRRAAATNIDFIVFGIPLWIIGYVPFTPEVFDPTSAVYLRAVLISYLAWWLYEAVMLSGSNHATLGKKWMGIKVLRADSLKGISFARATARYLAWAFAGSVMAIGNVKPSLWVATSICGALLFLVGYLMQPFTKRRQALHDLIAGTVVIAESGKAIAPWGVVALNVAGPAAMVIMGIAVAVAFLGRGSGDDADAAFARGDYATALPHFQWYANAGNAKAQVNLGVMYQRGQGVPQDEVEGVKWWRRAANQGDPRAQYNLGFAYQSGQGVAQDYAEARKWYQKAADQEDAKAQVNLGAIYHNGQGVPQDYAEARKWYEKAADQGNAIAQFNLGLLYATGQGVAQDYAEARKWYQKAADQGQAYAQFNLGNMYDDGQGGPQDFVEAHKWYNLAISRLPTDTRNDAVINRDIAASNMTPSQIAEAEKRAAEWKPK